MNPIKILFNTYKIPMLIILVGIALAIGLAYVIFQPSRDYVTKMIGDLAKQQNELIMKNYQDQTKKQETQFQEMMDKLKESDEKIKVIKQKVSVKQYEITTTSIPTSPEELHRRFIKLGYTPVN